MTETDLRNAVKTNVRNHRERLKLNRAQLAERADIAPDYLGRVERGLKLPSLPVLLRIAHGLGIGLIELLRAEGRAQDAEDPASKRLQQFIRGLTSAQHANVLAILTKLRSADQLRGLRIALRA